MEENTKGMIWALSVAMASAISVLLMDWYVWTFANTPPGVLFAWLLGTGILAGIGYRCNPYRPQK